MRSIPLRISTDVNITVTNTATELYTLMDTASTLANAKTYYDQASANAIMISAEGGDIRYLLGTDPTASDGTLISKGTTWYIPGIELSQLKLISTAGNFAVTVVPYLAELGDSPAMIANDITVEAVMPLPDGASTAAKQLPDGHNVTVDNEEDDPVFVKQVGLGGASTDGTVALASADTWYQVPTTAPASPHVLVVSKENASGVIRWSFTNGGTPGVTNGNKMTGSDLIFELAASEVVYFGSSSAGDDVNWVTKII